MNDLRITVNGEPRTTPSGTTVAALVATLGMDAARVAVERNQDVVPRRTWAEAQLVDGDHVEIVAFVGGGAADAPRGGAADADDPLVIAGRTFKSRLLVGTGKYATIEQGREAILRSGAEIVTVALRRVDMTPGKPNVLHTIDRKRHTLLPNTAGCYTADEAVRTCRLARELGMADMVKLEVIGDTRTLFPDGAATLEAARILVKDGFTVLPYCMDDPVLAKKLADVGCAAVMPLAAPIGSGLGIRNPYNLRIILELLESAKVPVIVDAGVGTASDAAVALELGCDGVLMNTAIAGARDPLMMAEAMRDAVIAGRKAFRAGRIPRKLYASASSPLDGLIE
ncbi:MAG TPA: sulfur carrier protein ThiS [Polyangia bacterium]|jgi:thiazole synthase|nr:sulfur carrier protein ThiS [Polyangia bacterium]